MVNRTFLIAAVALFAGCNMVDFKGFVVPTGDVVDTRFEMSVEKTEDKALARIETAENYLFYVSTDPHIDDTAYNLREFVGALRNDSAASFGVVLGDCIDRKNTFPNYVAALEYSADVQAVNLPIFSLIGNHDLYFSGWDDFYKYVGPSVYWFEVVCGDSCDLFIAIDSASGTLGRRQLKWLQQLLEARRNNYRHCIVMTHTNLFYTDNSQTGSGNMTMEETAILTNLFSKKRVTLCLQGHDHYREDLTFGGVRYTIVGTIRDDFEKPEFLTILVSKNGVEYDWKYLK